MADSRNEKTPSRRTFIKTATLAGLGFALADGLNPVMATEKPLAVKGKRVGIIGLDTSHAVAFAKTLNSSTASPQYKGYKVVAAYPKGSNDIESSVARIPKYTEEVQKLGVEIVDSISALLKKVDVVLLETNDGRPHLEQAMQVLKAGKRMFIDKPVAASLADTKSIFQASERYKTPIFSSSSLRYMDGIADITAGKIGKVAGASTYSPAVLEKTHPDLFWYGIHGVEILYALMGTGCQSLSRVHTEDTDVVTGIWKDGRVGTFRGTRTGKKGYGATVFGEKAIVNLDKFSGYDPLLLQIINFFDTGIPPVKPEETLEIYAFMEAADRSKAQGGAMVNVPGLL